MRQSRDIYWFQSFNYKLELKFGNFTSHISLESHFGRTLERETERDRERKGEREGSRNGRMSCRNGGKEKREEFSLKWRRGS